MSEPSIVWGWKPPIEMPNPLPVNKKGFELSYQQEVTPVGYGFIQTIERASPFWVASFETPPLSFARDQLLQQFFDQLNGAENTFLGYDLRKPRPHAYTIFTGLEKITEADYSESRVRLAGFSAGAVLTAGDYISYQDGYIWRLHRVKETVTADGSGNFFWVKVTPRPRPLSQVCLLRLEKPACEMKILGKVDKQDQVDNPGPSYRFSAVQFIQRGHP